MASSFGVTTALAVTPMNGSTFTPQVTVTSFHQDFALATSGVGPNGFAESVFERNSANASATFQLDLADESPQGHFQGSLYLVAINNFVLTDESGPPIVLSQAAIDDRTVVQSSISIGGSTYTATANYQAATNDWLLTANLPQGATINMTVGEVNHHFNFVVPVSDGAGVALSTSTALGISAFASAGPDVGSTANSQLTTSALAWGTATPNGLSPLSGDFNGDGAVDDTDFNIWRANFGIPFDAAQPQGDGNLTDLSTQQTM